MSTSLTALIPGVGHEYAHVATAAIVTGGLVLATVVGRASLGTGEAAIVPSNKFSIRGLFELLVEFIQGLVDMVMGEEGRKYIPMLCSIFAFIFIQNLVGMIPGMSPATENLNMTVGMGLFMFITYNLFGIKENKWNYLKHFFGPVALIAPLYFVVEIISHLVRPVSLGLRLGSVMKGDHTVVGIFLDLVPIGLPIPFYLLGMFVCFIQAMVFTLLSMIYISLATAHEH